MTRALSGIKPTGNLHLGNYLGMIRPALALAEKSEKSFYFIADVHALNTLRDRKKLQELTLDITAGLLALGLDENKTIIYRQSDVTETFELATILSSVTPKGMLNRSHAYKAAVAANEKIGKSEDDGVNMGLFTYPILMAADILLMDADKVPVGRDQSQHVEIAHDIAQTFNSIFGPTLHLPQALIDTGVEIIVGLDGRKMSKSYKNTIPLFAEQEEVKRLVARIKTDSKTPQEIKNADSCSVFALYRQFASIEETMAMRERYSQGGLAYSEAKLALADIIERELGDSRTKFKARRKDIEGLQTTLHNGSIKARKVAQTTIYRVREAVGLGQLL